MTMESDFQSAQGRVKSLKKRPANEELLELYALFKQGTAGDAEGKRPGLLDIKGRAKYDAWASHKGLDSEAAREKYVSLVKSLEDKYGLV
jgi:diazepam-binding inhibitor (GABA receptor modulator, acyl-CoA-binding protein)